MKKNVLIVTSEFPPQPGGIGNHALHLALNLSNQGYQVSVIADQREGDHKEEMAFDAHLPFTVQRIPIKVPRFLMYIHRIIKTLQAIKQADYVIATGKFSLWSVAFCSLFYKRETLAVIHGTEVNFKTPWLRQSIAMSLKRFDTLVAVSNYTKSLMGHIQKEVVVIPNGIDLSQWQTEGILKATLQGHPVLTTVGRVSTRKGQLQVIKLLPALKQRFPDLHYHCVGIPTEADACMAQAKALGVADQVTFHGAVPESSLKSLLLATDVFVMLSTESETGDVEGFGIAILEANALGIPAIGAKGCGIEDAINHGVTGFLIDGNDGLAFKKSLEFILDKRLLFKEHSKTWAKQHDWHMIIKKYIALLP
ncbi:glycosyltransferase family 4 protein [Xanthomarina gelatinilytica]|uniref:glycosyltransferase family 4 protein n=1 Tax=Xanthomarina gelatinilytica TaxID=1137281 RepID=UPI003AA93276